MADTIDIAAQTAQGMSHTVGDAIGAYQMSQHLEQQKQELEQKRQQNEMDKGTWLATQFSNIARYDGQPETQKFIIQSLKKQLPMVAPGINPDSIDLVGKDAAVRNSLGFAAADAIQKGSITPDSFQAMVSVLGSPQAVADHAQKIQDNRARVAEAQAKAQTFEDRITSQQQMGAQHQWESEFAANKPITQRIEGATRIQNLIAAAARGDFKSNKAFLGQINAEVSRLETGAQNPGLGQAEKTELESAAANIGAVRDKFFNQVTDVNLKAQAQQALGMVGDLKNSYIDMANRKADELKAGALPSQLPILQAKHQQFLRNYHVSPGTQTQAPPVTQAAAATPPGGSGVLSFEQWQAQKQAQKQGQ